MFVPPFRRSTKTHCHNTNRPTKQSTNNKPNHKITSTPLSPLSRSLYRRFLLSGLLLLRDCFYWEETFLKKGFLPDPLSKDF